MRPFHHLLVNNLVANVTNFTVWFALTFWVYLETRSVFATGMIAGLYLALTAGLAFWLGSLVDHHRKKRVMLGSSVASAGFYAAALTLLALATLALARTALRCAWKAPGAHLLCAQYALHAHFQKIPALFGQLRWRRAARSRSEIALVDYKQPATHTARNPVKALLVQLLLPLAWCRRVLLERAQRVWNLVRLQEALGRRVDPSNVILGSVELHGTRNIQFGRGALIYPGVYLETQGAGSITLGDDVVLSRGVHIVAFASVTLGRGCMVGEYASIRDANHRSGADSLRHSGHVCKPIEIGAHVWVGRGVSVLMGASIGDHSVLGANAVLTKPVSTQQVLGGVPARSLHPSARTPSSLT